MSEDLIRRSDAIDALKNALCELGGDEWGDGELGVHADDIDAVINDIPAIEPKRGEWIEHKERTIVRDGNFVDFFPTEYECSNCGLRRATYFIDSPLSNYCPNCGARMKGADDE